jgi:acetylornithine deacetylase
LSQLVPAVEILRELVAIPTPSAVSNLPLLRWVAAFLDRRGWRVVLLQYLDQRGVEKANLVARPGAVADEDKIDLAFVCHTDTVRYDTNWAGALALQEREGLLHGCGSCDVKGSLACFLAAVSSLEPDAIARGAGLILTADEEIGCKGMEQLLAREEFRHIRIGSAIVSEPTSLQPGVAGKGYGLAQITVEGKEAHSAFPQQGVSAISIAARLIGQIEDRLDADSDGAGVDRRFDPPRTTLNIGVIEGGTAKNIISGRCRFLVEWRAVPGEPPDEMLRKLHAVVKEAQDAAPQAVIYIEGLRAEPGFAPASRGPLQLRLASLLPGGPTGISFGSEASRMARIADEVIVIGPGDMRSAHSDRECVPVAELEEWTAALSSLLRTGLLQSAQ